MRYIKYFEDIRLSDLSLVGGKNASLGEMITQLSSQGIRVPFGFAITADAYWYYLKSNELIERIKKTMDQLIDVQNITVLSKVAAEIRGFILQGNMPDD